MELLQLKYFLELAKTEHLSKTAEKLMISPPSLSSTIHKLEDELGTELFDRKKQRMYLNENGRIFYSYVSESLNSLRSGIDAISNKKNIELNVAMTSQPVYSDMLYEYEQSHPSTLLHTSVIPVTALDQPDVMKQYDFYCGIIEDINPKYFEYQRLYESEEPVVLISKRNPLSKRKSIKLRELKNEEFISVLPENTSAHWYMMRIFEKEHFRPKKIYYGGYLIRIKMVRENKAVAITTEVGAHVNSIPMESIAIIPLEGELPTRTQSVCWDKRKQLTDTQKEFVNFAIEYFKSNPLLTSNGE